MRRRCFRERSERGVTVQTMLLITVFVLAVGASGVWVFNLVRDTGDSLEQAARGKLIYQTDCDLQFAQPKARPLPWGMTEDSTGSKLLLHQMTLLDGRSKQYRYWEFPLSETLSESREKAELNLIGQALQGPENISLTSEVSTLRFYDRFTVPFRSLSINTPQQAISVRYRSLPQYMHPAFEDAIPDGGPQQNQQNAFEAITPPPTAPPADFLRLVENLVIAFNPRDGCWGFRLQGVEPPPPAATTTTSSTSSTSSTTTSSTSSTTAAPQTPGTPAPPAATPWRSGHSFAAFTGGTARHLKTTDPEGNFYRASGCDLSGISVVGSTEGVRTAGQLPDPSHSCLTRGSGQAVPYAVEVRVDFGSGVFAFYDAPLP